MPKAILCQTDSSRKEVFVMWKDIVGYEGYYQVSDTGEVRSVDRYVYDPRMKRNRLLRGQKMKTPVSIRREKCGGYPVVNLHKDGVGKVFPVHKLVASSFIPNPYELPTINHIDGNKLNNNVSNLEWASYKDNNIHALRNNLRKPRGNRIIQFDKDGNIIGTYKSTCDASRKTGVTVGSISQCICHRTHTAGGYIWIRESEGATTIPTGSTPETDTGGSASHP